MSEKLTIRVTTKPLIESRAAAAGQSMGAYLDALVREDDLRDRIAADSRTMEAAGLNSPERRARHVALLRASRTAL